MSKKQCNCGLCKPEPGKRYHPVYGFDLDAVPEKYCLRCNTPIGTEEYVLETAVARFGTMQVLHKRCAGADYKEKVPRAFKAMEEST